MIENSASKYTVLIVDDVPTNIMLVQAILKREGYNLITTDNGITALKIIKEKTPNLILLDIMMPEMDGYEVLKQLKEDQQTKDIPVIIMSALNDMHSIVKGYQLGAVEYVTKPFQREELIKRVAHRYELFSINNIKQELEATIEARDALYSVIAHDLRSPLGSLKMMNSAILMMVDKNQVSAEVMEMLHMMNKTSEEVFSLLDNLLKWSKNRLNRTTPQIQTLNLNEIITETCTMFSPMGNLKKINIKEVLPSEKLICDSDSEMIKTIIRNLLSNAIKYTFEGGEIIVSLSYDSDIARIEVKDNGTGIKKEDQEKIIKSNVNNFTTYGTNNEKGAGFGLSICRDFAQMLGGKLWFESEEGKGTSFYFSLKLSEVQN